ncbi:phospholipase D-like domain-containing protein [Alkaliflexus imshenetskii]|uniref:phospholipase D-like domain-containing protein n=1 Tax=Alkaliflexus imshenetskii TaxID=286730 RepID=UPI00047BA15E|nr:phospholipase D-like domain-containing protein [Alkaliflexus imshenetskii]
MKPLIKKTSYIAIYLLFTQIAFGQQVSLNQNQLPYTIPIIDQPSTGYNIEYQWLENNNLIKGATSAVYAIPKNKKPGTYIYVNQVRCIECTDWLSSNPFTVNITGVTLLKSSSIPTANLSASFSPQNELYGYLDQLISVIDNAQTSLDICLYSLEDYDVYLALKRAAGVGVQIRMLYEGALEDRKKNDNTISHKIEELGIDVKYVNKTNHHKFIISDNNYLVTSSGNWNNKANWVYDENTLRITDEELILRYRAEFEYLWNNSREFGASYEWSTIDPDSLLNLIVDSPDVDAVFTSSNYRTYISGTHGPTFAKVMDNQKVADKIVELINHSHSSIKIAANHLRSRPISEALIAKKAESPAIEIQVYLDGQEYISEGYNIYQKAKRDECLAGATTAGQIRDCMEKNFYYSYELILVGIDVRFKLYSYSWHHNTAALMHHKYAVFDDSIVATGSYNYSYNAETNSMENVVVFNRNASNNSVDAYLDNFTEIWETGRTEGYYDDIIGHINSDSRYIPVLFPSMSLNHTEVTSLKEEIQTACPTLLDKYFKDNKQYFSSFLRDVDLYYDGNDRLTTALDARNNEFSIDYAFNDYNQITDVSFQGNHNLQFTESYGYDGNGNLTTLNSPLLELNLTYTNNELSTLYAGQGAHSWTSTGNGSGITSTYSMPGLQDYLTVHWNDKGLPISIADSDSRIIEWTYDAKDVVSSIASSTRNIQFTVDSLEPNYNVFTSDGEDISIEQDDINSLKISSTGTVASTVEYLTEVQLDKNISLTIDITSDNISSGIGRTTSIAYLLDPYGRVISSGGLSITRAPYTGNITFISNNDITETRNYNDWELLTEKTVVHNGEILFKANYQYDALQRITQTTEIILGDTSVIDYIYNGAGQLHTVYKNGVQTESYVYDNYGNRQLANKDGFWYSYTTNANNRLETYTWEQSGNTRLVDFIHNNSGQLLSTANKSLYNGYPQTTSSRDYSYDVFGNLNSVTWASQTQHYIYDGYDRQIATYQNGSVKRKLIFGLGSTPLAELNMNDRIINTFVYADSHTPLLMRKGNVDYYIISDIRGSVRMVLNIATGAIRQQIDYDAFGKVITDTNPGYTPFGYAGGLYDYRTNLIRFGARDYYPEIGRWTAEDPIGFLSGDINFYAYCANDPVNFVDLNGLSKSGTKTTALAPYYPPNNGALGPWERIYLRPGQLIDRYGKMSGRYFSPVGTPMSMRALPYNAKISNYKVFEVVKPFEVQSSTIAPAFGKIGLGKQYLSPVSAEVLVNRGIIAPVK